MCADQGKFVNTNTALLRFLDGTWNSRITPFMHSEKSELISVCMRLESLKVRGRFRLLSTESVAGDYEIVQESAEEEELATDCIIRLEHDPAADVLVAFLDGHDSVPGTKGTWSSACLRFCCELRDTMALWDLFQAIWPEVNKSAPTASILIRQASESSWLLDVCFELPQSDSSQANSDNLRYRVEFWHYSEGTCGSTPAHPPHVQESFKEVLRRCDDVEQDVESRIAEINELIESLEESKSKYQEQLRRLGEVRSSAATGKDDATSLDDEMREAILEMHANTPVPEAETVSGGGGDTVGRIWSELDDLQADAESLDSEIDSIETDVDLPDLLGTVWTNAEYARGQRILQAYRDRLPAPDLSFLGSLEASTNKLSRSATKIVKTTAVHYQLALHGEIEELDYAPPIASMAKACERILDEVFKEKSGAIETDQMVGRLFADVSSWQFRIPADISNVTSGDLISVVKLIKKSVEAKTPINWKGMGNKRIGLLLFGGWIPTYSSSAEHYLNPLGVNTSAEFVQDLPARLSEFQSIRNGFLHHDVAGVNDLLNAWSCFRDCLKGLLQAFYSVD